MPHTLVTFLQTANSASEGHGPNPWLVGGGALLLLLILLTVVVSIGGGRDHS